MDWIPPNDPVVAEAGLFPQSVLSASWPLSGIRAFSTLRGPLGHSAGPCARFNLGLRCGDALSHVVANREALVCAGGLPATPRWLHQVHGSRVVDCDINGDSDGDAEPEADAAITRRPGVVLAILHADCLPVLFASSNGDRVGAAHAGWRGLASGVLENTVYALGGPPSALHAWLGPAAGPQRYEVGDEVRAAFVGVDADAAAAFTATRPGYWLCDLYELARRRLARAGVQQVHGGGHCTISDAARFFSYRRDPDSGRMASLIWMQQHG